MKYRKFLADKVFDGNYFLPRDRVVIADGNGRIEDIVPKEQAGEEIEILPGILTPGLINSHCHLELSYLKGQIAERTGLIDFLLSVVALRKRQQNIGEVINAMVAAEKEMYENGIAGVGDIANTDHAIAIKTKSKIAWYTFIELLNFFDESLAERINHNQDILRRHQQSGLQGSLTAHAPYTVNKKTFQVINTTTKAGLLSIHNQETAAENELFKNGTGDFLKLYAAVGLAVSPVGATGKSSVQSYLPELNHNQKILLVHNTHISEDDIRFIREHEKDSGLEVVFCLCPNANLYIEDALPPIDLLLKYNCNIVLGTDSYSSNWQLSIAQEVKTIIDHFPHVPLEKILRWATFNGASYFGWDELGKIAKGQKPGLTLLEQNEKGITGVSKRVL